MRGKPTQATKGPDLGGNGSKGPPTPPLGPPTIPIDQVYGMIRELELSHQILDAIGAPPGPLPDRLAQRAQNWLKRVGVGSQTRIGIESRKVIQARGQDRPGK